MEERQCLKTMRSPVFPSPLGCSLNICIYSTNCESITASSCSWILYKSSGQTYPPPLTPGGSRDLRVRGRKMSQCCYRYFLIQRGTRSRLDFLLSPFCQPTQAMLHLVSVEMTSRFLSYSSLPASSSGSSLNIYPSLNQFPSWQTQLSRCRWGQKGSQHLSINQ